MSRYSGKCDLYDWISMGKMHDADYIRRSEIYVGDKRIYPESERDLMPYYGNIISSASFGADSAVIRLMAEPWPDYMMRECGDKYGLYAQCKAALAADIAAWDRAHMTLDSGDADEETDGAWIYESHLGGLYASSEEIPYDILYCEECGDSDSLIGYAESRDEARAMLKEHYGDEEYGMMRAEVRELLDRTFGGGTHGFVESSRFLEIVRDDGEYAVLSLDDDEDGAERACFESLAEAERYVKDYEERMDKIAAELFTRTGPCLDIFRPDDVPYALEDAMDAFGSLITRNIFQNDKGGR